jgi:hypothetical protein
MRSPFAYAVVLVLAACAAIGWLPRSGVAAFGQHEGHPAAALVSHAENAAEAEVLKLDQQIADAVVRGDTAYVERVTPADFVMVHGDGWTNGGKPLLTDTKQSMLRRVTTRYYDVIDFDSVRAEMHGDVAITYGRYIAHTTNGGDPAKAWFSVWFERVYAKRAGRWTYLSHRTVHGPTYGADRRAVSDK